MSKDSTNLKKRNFVNVENAILHTQVCEISVLFVAWAILIVIFGYITLMSNVIMVGYGIMVMICIMTIVERVYRYKKFVPDYSYKIIEAEEYIIIKNENMEEQSIKFVRSQMKIDEDSNEKHLIYVSDETSKMPMYAKQNLLDYLGTLVK